MLVERAVDVEVCVVGEHSPAITSQQPPLMVSPMTKVPVAACCHSTTAAAQALLRHGPHHQSTHHSTFEPMPTW